MTTLVMGFLNRESISLLVEIMQNEGTILMVKMIQSRKYV